MIFLGENLHKNFSGKFREIQAKSFAPPKFACSYTYDEKAPPLPLPLFWKGRRGNALAIPPFSGEPMHIILRALLTRCCRLQCVTAMNMNYSGPLRRSSSWLQNISGNALKHGRRTPFVLRQGSSQLQKYKAAQMSRRIAIDQRVCVFFADIQGWQFEIC